jgi:predicted dinucleotide-binding enzyme
MTTTLRRLATILTLALAALLGASPSYAQSDSLRIGIIGTGNIGGALARHWANAGHEVFVSSRHPEELQALVDELGPRAQAGLPADAAAFGDIILVSVPYSAMPQVGAELAPAMAGKVVLDTSNPVARRDGAITEFALGLGSGVATAQFLPGARIVRAYNCIPAASLAGQANRQPARIAIPLAGDDAEALEIAQRLVSDSGFDPVVVGPLEVARHFDLGQPLARGDLSAAEYRALIDEVL